MSVPARVLWVGVLLSLVLGAVVVGAAARSRAAAAEELQSVNKRWNEVREEAREQPLRINSLREDRKDRLALRRECFVVVAIQIRAVRQLMGDLRTRLSSPSELDVYSDRARELLLAFRQLLSNCEGG